MYIRSQAPDSFARSACSLKSTDKKVCSQDNSGALPVYLGQLQELAQ